MGPIYSLLGFLPFLRSGSRDLHRNMDYRELRKKFNFEVDKYRGGISSSLDVANGYLNSLSYRRRKKAKRAYEECVGGLEDVMESKDIHH